MTDSPPTITPRKHAGYGWIADLPDQRDYLFSAPPERMSALPPEVNLEPSCPEVYQQGQLGSCTAQAIAGAIQFERRREGLPDYTPSRLFIYWQERCIEGTINEDCGAMLRDGMKVVSKLGAPPESLWPYEEGKFSTKPPDDVYDDARQDTVLRYLRLSHNLQQLKACLADGFPFVFGFTVYDAFESEEVAKSGMLNLPQPGEAMLGGHAVMAVGYSDSLQAWKIRNSWSSAWGINGYFWMPYPYLLERGLSNDFWTVRQLSGTAASLRASHAD